MTELIKQRRFFILNSTAVCGAVVLGSVLSSTGCASATAIPTGPELVKETDPAAKAVAYVTKSTKAQNCGSCILYSGKANDPAAECPLFPNKRVQAAGYCSSWAKKV